MGLKLEICDESDMARCFEILSEAFGHDHPYIDAAYPAHSTPAGRAVGAARMLKVMQTDPCTTFLKVVDTESGVMIAQAKWNIYRDTIPDEADLDGDFWETGEDKKYAQLLCNQYLIPRRKFIRESKGNVFSLDLLTVDPKYQRRGAGHILVRWGTLQADELGLACVVESTDFGLELYRSEGFEKRKEWETVLPAEWENVKGKQRFIWMVREPKM